eukprot:1371862-Amphidinium_carterae.1
MGNAKPVTLLVQTSRASEPVCPSHIYAQCPALEDDYRMIPNPTHCLLFEFLGSVCHTMLVHLVET